MNTRVHISRLLPIYILVVGFILAGNWAAPGALTITPTFDTTITRDANAASIEATIKQAIQVYHDSFSDPINVTIRFQEISTSGLVGQSNWWYYNIPYSTFRGALSADATTADDATALAHLPTGATNPVTGTSAIKVKTADIRALRIAGSYPSGLAGGVDGIIGLHTSITNPPNNPASRNYSLLAITEHEIDEVLGLASALPSIGSINPYPEDLFRYDSTGGRNFTTAGNNAYFSIDGKTDLARFNQSGSGDYGDWFSTGPHKAQVQDAFLTLGASPAPAVELTALDVMGYDRVPEPSGIAWLIALVPSMLRTRQWRA